MTVLDDSTHEASWALKSEVPLTTTHVRAGSLYFVRYHSLGFHFHICCGSILHLTVQGFCGMVC